MHDTKWLFLQLFADGGEGDGAAETGDNAASPAAGDDRLRELGVPESVLQRRAQREAKYGKRAVPAKVAAAPKEEPKEAPKESQKKTFKELMDDPEYNQEMQRTVQQRLGKAKAAEDNMKALAPAIELLTRRYGLDSENLDISALVKAISDDDSYYEDKALELGVPVETAKQIDKTERDSARQKREEERTLEQQRIEQHFAKLQEDAAKLKEAFPAFDLRTELQNETFVRLTAPGSGLTVEDAYFALHREEIQNAQNASIARNTAMKMANAVRSGTARPSENGTSSQAPSVTTFDYSRASKEERDALKARIRAAAARGEKLYPGQ